MSSHSAIFDDEAFFEVFEILQHFGTMPRQELRRIQSEEKPVLLPGNEFAWCAAWDHAVPSWRRATAARRDRRSVSALSVACPSVVSL